MNIQSNTAHIGHRLQRARKGAGFSIEALSVQVGMPVNDIKLFEQGASVPGSAALLQLADSLGVRVEYFMRPETITPKDIAYHARTDLPPHLLDKLTFEVMDNAERWAELLSLYPEADKPVPDTLHLGDATDQVSSFSAIDERADLLRKEWQLGQGPIASLTDILEAHGVQVVFTTALAGTEIHGLGGMIGKTPFIMVSDQLPGDLQRFTLAHELGRLYLQGRRPNDLNESEACDRFASAFLFPTAALQAQFGPHRTAIEPRELYLLKHKYGISMQAIEERLCRCGIITEMLYSQALKQPQAACSHTTEPGEPYPQEQGVVFAQQVYRALSESYIGESKAAELLGQSVSHFARQRKL